jgi:hypothetical protein
LMRLCSYGTCIGVGFLALPLSGAGLTFFAAAKTEIASIAYGAGFTEKLPDSTPASTHI